MDSLFRMASMPGASKLKIREAICIDCPNHGNIESKPFRQRLTTTSHLGEASALNDDALLQPEYFNNFTCAKYATAVHHFLTAGPEHGAQIDFKKRNLVGIGHSLGAVSM